MSQIITLFGFSAAKNTFSGWSSQPVADSWSEPTFWNPNSCTRFTDFCFVFSVLHKEYTVHSIGERYRKAVT